MDALPPHAGTRVRVKAIARTAFAAMFSLSGLAFLWHSLFARRGVRILAYHGVERSTTSPFSVSLENFERQIAYISQHFDILSFQTFLDWMDGAYHSDKPKLLLTFDDGFLNNLTNAVPVLASHRMPATFFVIASKLGNGDERFMKTIDVRNLLSQSDLFRVGSHSLSHLSISRIDADEKDLEIGSSKAVLESALGMAIPFFCYPYGTFNDFDESGVELLRRHGYLLACTSVNGVNFRGTNRFKLRRTKIEFSDDMKTFRRILGGAMDGWVLIDYFLRALQRPRAVQFGDARKPQSIR
jgi:peptidoglycan/xylan/chitin deacetylase (PgdA/CDA1 family)